MTLGTDRKITTDNDLADINIVKDKSSSNFKYIDGARHDWKLDEVISLFDKSFNDLIFHAQTIHRNNFDPNEIQLSTLMNIKTGGCQEDCKYCSQSSRYQTDVKASKLVAKSKIVEAAMKAKENGASRFCMGAAWRELKDRDLDKICDIVTSVKEIGLETCMTLGMLTKEQAEKLNGAGLDYYNHNIDTSEEYYPEVITSRTFSDRINTLENVRKSGMSVCSGGIIGLGEKIKDRASMLKSLANLPEHPKSVPINMLVPISGTPFADNKEISSFDLVKTIAVSRIMMPRTVIRLSAGRASLSDEGQALCFLAGANSIFYGDKLLTTSNPEDNKDHSLMERLGLKAANI